MQKSKILILTVSLLLVLSSLVFAESIKNPDTFIKADHNTLETLDPHFMVSTANTEIAFNVYDSLLSTDKEGNVSPLLAATVPAEENGLITFEEDGTTYIEVPLKENIKFHNGEIMTPEDAAWSFKRSMVVGGTSGEVEQLSVVLLEKSSFKGLVEELGFDAAFARVDNSVVSTEDSIIFKLPEPFVPFLSMLSCEGADLPVFDKSWAVEQGAWPGTKDTARDYMDLTQEESVFHNRVMGTGPFTVSSWEPEERLVFERFDDYWQGPAKIARAIRQIVPEQGTAIMLLQRGDVDWVRFETTADMVRLEGNPDIKMVKNQPSNQLLKMNYVFEVKKEGNRYIGSGELGDGIPPNFFSDINLRKAFAYSFDRDAFIEQVFEGNALKPYGPVLVGFPTANPDNPQYEIDLEKAEEYFKKAWDGEVWEKGFKFTVAYNSGSVHRQRALEMLKDTVESLNPKFQIEITSLPWSAWVGAINQELMPISLFGVIPAISDPYFPIFTHMHSEGYYADKSGYIDLAKQKYDPLIDELGSNFNQERRKELSYELQRLSYEDCLSIFHFQGMGHAAMRKWVQGYEPTNPISTVNLYPIYKEN